MRSAHTQRGGSDASVEHRGGVLIITEIVRGAEERDGRGKKRTNDLVQQAMTTLPGTVLADYKWRLM